MGNLEFLQDLDYKSVSNILLFRQYKSGRMSRQTDICGYANTWWHGSHFTLLHTQCL